MSYATQSDLSDKFGDGLLIQLTDRAEVATGQIDNDVVDQALADADALIDGYLAGRYALPLVTTPTLINGLAKSIAIYKLHTFPANDQIKDEYKDALNTLHMISTGAVKLDVAGKEPAQTGGGSARVTDRPRPMQADKMKSFI